MKRLPGSRSSPKSATADATGLMVRYDGFAYQMLPDFRVMVLTLEPLRVSRNGGQPMEEQPVVRAFPCPAGVSSVTSGRRPVQGAGDEWSSPLRAPLLAQDARDKAMWNNGCCLACLACLDTPLPLASFTSTPRISAPSSTSCPLSISFWA